MYGVQKEKPKTQHYQQSETEQIIIYLLLLNIIYLLCLFAKYYV